MIIRNKLPQLASHEWLKLIALLASQHRNPPENQRLPNESVGGDFFNGPRVHVINRLPGDLAIEVSQVLGHAVDFADMAGDSGLLVVRKHLPLEPGPTPTVEQIGMRALRQRGGLQDAMHLVFASA
ncbi:hypothetical protein, partial [Mesorhizobium sp.]|uniref:hypothetical protein n=1 Tax=Mesorhizobium sp. TaxID=1871066 RepID=UPI0025FF0ADF